MEGGFMTGGQANNLMINTGAGVANVIISVFSAVGMNKYVQTHRFKQDDVVVEETQRDNWSLVIAAGTFFLLIMVIVVLLKKKK